MTGKSTYEELKKRIQELEQGESEHKRAEKELFFKEDILKFSSCAISTCDLEGNMTYGNPFFQKLWGFANPGEFLGKPFHNFWLLGNQDEDIMRALQSEWTWTGELKGIRKDGSLFDVQVSAATVSDGTGNPIALTSTSIDITEQKWTEKFLQESDEQRHLFLEHVPNLAIQGYTSDGTNVYWNPASETLYGYPACEAIGKSIFDLIIPPEMKTEIQSAISQMMATGEPIPSGEVSLRRKDGSYVFVYSGHAMAHIPGKEPQFFCMDFDLTERKATEAKFQQLQKIESLGRMAGAIAHNFNNQFQIAIGSLEITMNSLPKALEPNKNIVTAIKAVQKAAEVTRQMLIYLGQTSGKHEPIDLSGACRKSLSMLKAEIPKGITLNVDFPGSGPVIRANEGQINQVLVNLITNAWESISNNQGTISLAVRTVTQENIPTLKRFPMDWIPQPVHHACLEVSDTGCGITSMDIENIFDPFFTTNLTGRGMGLSVVMGIVKTHGGCITVENEAGSGIVFQIYLPVFRVKEPNFQKSEEKPIAQEPVKKSAKGTGKILLMDDEKAIRTFQGQVINSLGYNVETCIEGKEAIEIYTKAMESKEPFDVIILDLTNKIGMGGQHTMKRLLELDSDVKGIIISGYFDDPAVTNFRAYGFSEFIIKPATRSEWSRVITKVISKDI